MAKVFFFPAGCSAPLLRGGTIFCFAPFTKNNCYFIFFLGAFGLALAFGDHLLLASEVNERANAYLDAAVVTRGASKRVRHLGRSLAFGTKIKDLEVGGEVVAVLRAAAVARTGEDVLVAGESGRGAVRPVVQDARLAVAAIHDDPEAELPQAVGVHVNVRPEGLKHFAAALTALPALTLEVVGDKGVVEARVDDEGADVILAELETSALDLLAEELDGLLLALVCQVEELVGQELGVRSGAEGQQELLERAKFLRGPEEDELLALEARNATRGSLGLARFALVVRLLLFGRLAAIALVALVATVV